MDPFKEKILDYCKSTVRRKIELISFSLDEISGSMENETKSSLGDKHETSRARMQSEQEKLVWQMDELKGQYELLRKMDTDRSVETVSNQNLVYTNSGIFFIVVPIGKIELEEKVIYVISSNSPIGKKMIGLKAGERFEMNGIHYVIERIL